MDNIILIGFMGCGKTSVGIRLSYQLRRIFLDTDKLIEQGQGRSVSRIFAEDGEAYFRALETETIAGLREGRAPCIIATGGGLPVKPENRPLLRALGRVIYLKAMPETVYERLRGDTERPRLRCADPLSRIRELMRERETAYADAADVTVFVDGKEIDMIVKEIEEKAG